MNFFDASIEQRARLAMRRTQKNLDYGWALASRHPEQAALVMASLLTLMAFTPDPVCLVLFVSALALVCFNFIKPPSGLERALDSILTCANYS